MLLVRSETSEPPDRLVPRGRHWWTRVAANVLASSLDRQLAQGRAPESSLLLAARAQALVSPALRETYAGFWQHLSRRAALLPSTRTLRGPFNREAIGACRVAMAEVHRGLTADGPVSARGVAMVSRLLGDGTGPLYDHRVGPAQLDATLRDVMTALRPGLFESSVVEPAT
jgi:hypothetical protein